MKTILAIICLASIHFANANITLPSVIGSNMVLQQKTSVKLWGSGNPTEKVIVTTSWNGRVDSTRVDGNAKWQLSVQTPPAGGPFTITIKGQNTIVLENVLIGEVWICSGQSNMEMNYTWGMPQMKEEFLTANRADIRFFQIPRRTALAPQENVEGKWVPCDSNTLKFFSAVAYYFGKKLNENLHVPIGLIHTSWGGTPAETWTPDGVVMNDPVLKEAAQKLKPTPWWPITPGYTYNAMIAPFINYSIAGAIWYQGEANTGTAATYSQLLTSMIGSWRQKWNIDFPFYYVQLAPFAYDNKNVAALLREQQTKTLSFPKTGMAVITDLADDTADIHPKNKRDVGYRLANLALTGTYQQNITGAISPLFKSMAVNKNKVVLSFENVAHGLVQKDKSITGFFVAGSDKKFSPAKATIAGNTIIVWSESVAQPVAVRYAFSNTAVGNVFSKEGLPLSAFRTDDWEVDTSSVK